MSDLLSTMRKSPVLSRVVPYIAFLVLTAFQGDFGEAGRYWVYLLKTLVGAWLLWEVRGVVAEMKWNFTPAAVGVGVLVLVLWIGLDPFIPRTSELAFILGFGEDPAKDPVKPWNPFVQFGDGSALGWFFVLVRIAGSTLVVPPLEEVFYRSFLYRYLISPEFERVSLSQRHTTSLVLTSVFFGFVHQEWLAGILCGIAFQVLVWRTGRIGDAITAHALTNLLLGIWVVSAGAWKFW